MTVSDIARKLPTINVLRDRCRALAVLERIIDSGEPYYSYTREWGSDEAALMSNGSERRSLPLAVPVACRCHRGKLGDRIIGIEQPPSVPGAKQPNRETDPAQLPPFTASPALRAGYRLLTASV